MVYCVQALLVYADAPTRDAKLAQAQGQIVGKPTFSITRLDAVDSPDGPAITLTIRFVSKADSLNLNNALKISGALPAVSWVQIHDCPHDESTDACAATVTRTVL